MGQAPVGPAASHIWPVAINMQHTDVAQIVNLPRFRQVRNLPHVADFCDEPRSDAVPPFA